jgi:hypothetical protein
MSNVYTKKLQVLKQLKLALAKAEGLAEELHDIEEREGDAEYADKAYGYYANELSDLLMSVAMELDAVDAMVDLEGAAPTDDPTLDLGDEVVDATGNVKGYIEDIFEKDNEVYANVDTGNNYVPVKLSALTRVNPFE